MKFNIPVFLAAASLLAGCSSTPTKVDHGAVHARTFNFVNRANRPAPAYADSRAEVLTMIQDAITQNLAAKGVTRVDSGGDITVAFLVIIGNNATTESINDYFGYGNGADELANKAQEAYTNNKNPNYFEAGTLLIDVIDNKDYKLIKRNYATRPLMRNITPEARAGRIQEAVDEILGDLRVEH